MIRAIPLLAISCLAAFGFCQETHSGATRSAAELQQYLLLGDHSSDPNSFRAALNELSRIADPEDQGLEMIMRGHQCSMLLHTRPRQTISFVEQQLALANDLSEHYLAMLYACRAMAEFLLGDQPSAFEWKLRSIAAAQQDTDPTLSYLLQLSLANLYNSSGQPRRALEPLLRVLPHFESLASNTWHARALNETAVSFLQLGLGSQAEEYLTRALSYPLPDFIAQEIRLTYAHYLSDAGLVNESLSLLDEIQASMSQLLPTPLLSIRLLRLANQNRLQQVEAASQELASIERLLASPIFSEHAASESLRLRLAIESAVLALNQGQYHLAIEKLEALLSFEPPQGSVTAIRHFLSQGYQAMGNFQQALEQQQLLMQEQQRIQTDVNLLQLASMQSLLINQAQEQENQRLRLQQELQQAQIEQLERTRYWQLISLILAFSTIGALMAFAGLQWLQRRKLRALAMMDELTGLSNRRAIMAQAEQFLKQAQPFALIIIDIDHFKLFNDCYGHQMGDQVLQQVANQLSQALRKPDALGRTGGEEFMLLLPEVNPKQSFDLAERLRLQIREIELPTGVEHPLSISLGIANWQQEASITELIARADKALYIAKNAGRNQSCLG